MNKQSGRMFAGEQSPKVDLMPDIPYYARCGYVQRTTERMFAKYISKQLHHPSGFMGRVILPRLFNRRNRVLNRLTLECLELESKDRVLEVGFGGGYLLSLILPLVPKGKAIGIDRSEEMVAFCKKNVD